MKSLKIVISGAAETAHCSENINETAYEIGKNLALNRVTTITGATTGTPFWVAKGAYEHNGYVIGISPAMNEKEHLELYNLPTDYHHLIFYTGFGHSLRNLILVRCGDGVIFICGRTGTLNEFVIAYEEKKPMGILLNSGGEEKYMDKIIAESYKKHEKIIWESDPKKLVEKMINLIKND
ncbi:MAG: LOG family protein [Patescibacteria group bacterium]|nr:LOG family protein [Patescibacteria group bacterium]